MLWYLSLCRKFKDHDVPSSLLKYVPETCAVYVVSSKGKVHQTKQAASQPQTPKSDVGTPRHNTTQQTHLPPQPHYGSDTEDIHRYI